MNEHTPDLTYRGDSPSDFYSIVLRAFDGWWARVIVQTGSHVTTTYEGYISRCPEGIEINPDDEATKTVRHKLDAIKRIVLT